MFIIILRSLAAPGGQGLQMEKSGGVNHGTIQSKDLLIHLWAGPLLSTPAEVLVGSNSVEVRYADVSRSQLLQRLYQCDPAESQTNANSPREHRAGSDEQDMEVEMGQVFSPRSVTAVGVVSPLKIPSEQEHNDEELFDGSGDKVARINLEREQGPGTEVADELGGEDAANKASPTEDDELLEQAKSLKILRAGEAHSFVFVAGDFLSRDEDVFQTIRRLTDPSQKEANEATKDPSKNTEPVHEDNAGEVAEDQDEASAPGQQQVADPVAAAHRGLDKVGGDESTLDDDMMLPPLDGEPEDYYFCGCTVGEKPSRAMFHLTDSDDVGFLLAKFAYHTTRSV